MGGLRRTEKHARLALRTGRALPPRVLPVLPVLLLLLPLVSAIGTKGTPDDIQVPRPAGSTRSGDVDHHLRRSTSVGDGDHPHPGRALSTDPVEDRGSENEGFSFSTRFVLEGDFKWMEEELSSTPASVSAIAAATAAAVGDLDFQSHRGMQTAGCSAGDDFSLTSTVHVEASGCYFEADNNTDAYFTADYDRIIIPASISASSSTIETFAWVAGKVLGFSGGALDVDPACVSDRSWTVNSHPQDAGSWSCLVGGTLVAFSQESFGVECGCPGEASGTPELASTPAPASGGDSATVTSPSSAGGLSCDASSITITSPQLDDFEGCYTDTAVDGTTSHYAQTGVGLEGGVKAVFAASVDERGHDVRWVAGTYANMSTDSGIVPTCISDDNATVVHPADSTWLCDIAGTGAFLPVNYTQFQVECGGCDSTSSFTSSEESTPSPGDSRNIAPSTSTGSSSSTNSGGSAAAAPTPSPNTEPAGAIESGTNGGLPGASSGALSTFGVTGLAAVVGLVVLFVGE